MGFFISFTVIRDQIRSEIKRKIENSLNDEQLEVIILPSEKIKSSVNWVREDKEFIYHNKMYDVVRKKEENGKTIYFCLNDKKEEKLFADLDDHVRKNLSQNGRLKQIISKSISNYYFEIITLPVTSLISITLHPEYNKSYSDFCGEIKSPPPKFS